MFAQIGFGGFPDFIADGSGEAGFVDFSKRRERDRLANAIDGYGFERRFLAERVDDGPHQTWRCDRSALNFEFRLRAHMELLRQYTG